MAKTDFIAELGRQETVTTRIFDAPRELVFKAWANPNLIPKWWGPKNLTTAVDKMDVRPGGLWRFVQRDAHGNVHAFNGAYHAVAQTERLVRTFGFEGMLGHGLLETVTFEEQQGKTKLTDRSVFQSREDRDEMLNTGMEAGASQSMDRLAELLASI